MGKILVIEDEPGTRMLLENNLRELGHEVVTAETGALGLAIAREKVFDLFLLDVCLGSGIDGYDVCRRLTTLPTLHATPVVLVSGKVTTRDDMHRGYEAGCSIFLLKTDIAQLGDVVRAMLRFKSVQDDLGMQNRLLEEKHRRLQEERHRGEELQAALRDSAHRTAILQELASGHPDGVLLVDADGIVRIADKGAQELAGRELIGKTLGTLAPASGLEAFVRDVHVELREGFRFDIPARNGRGPRSLNAVVVPFVPTGSQGDLGLRAVLLQDSGKRRMIADVLSLQEQGLPRREIGVLLEAARERYGLRELAGTSPAIQSVRRAIAAALGDGTPVLLEGPPGSGKESAARTLHYACGKTGFFVAVDCGALSRENAEAELFGCTKGAVPNVYGDRAGQVHRAHLGTLFLSEVHELPIEVQAKLVRLIAEGEARRVGASRAERVDTRVIASSSRDLAAEVQAGRFDADLMVALQRTSIRMPALSERREDVAPLAERFRERFGGALGVPSISAEAAFVLEQHSWPGNVSELASVIERSCRAAQGAELSVEHLPHNLRELGQRLHERGTLQAAARRGDRVPGTHLAVAAPAPAAGSGSLLAPPRLQPGQEIPISLEFFELWALTYALQRAEGDKLLAADMLGIGKSTLYRKLNEHKIRDEIPKAKPKRRDVKIVPEAPLGLSAGEPMA